MNDKGKLSNAIGMIDEELVTAADSRRNKIQQKKGGKPWFAAVAACAAVAVIGGTAAVMMPKNGGMLAAAAKYPETVMYPKESDYNGYDKFSKAFQKWAGAQKDRRAVEFDTPMNFYKRSAGEFLCNSDGENHVYSPLNVYMALSVLAETTDSGTRGQILDLLGTDDMDCQRRQTKNIWTANYRDDGLTSCVLANSLWLNDRIGFNKKTVSTIADDYYSSVFSGNFGDEAMTDALQNWINEQTGDLLSEYAEGERLSDDDVMAICSTVNFHAKWHGDFNKNLTAPQVFHTPNGDVETDFMHNTDEMGRYFWHDTYSASRLNFDGEGAMWFILPDEGVSVDTVLEQGDYLDMVCAPQDWEGQQAILMHWSVPKFDISSETDLIDGLQALGVTDVFDSGKSDFSPLTDVKELYISKADHAARVTIDEEGCTAAAYTIMISTEGAALAPGDEVDFVLDRPFIFVITSDTNQPLFIGTVNDPS